MGPGFKFMGLPKPRTRPAYMRVDKINFKYQINFISVWVEPGPNYPGLSEFGLNCHPTL